MTLIVCHELARWVHSEEAAVRRLQSALAAAGSMQRQPDRPWQDDDRALRQAISRLRLLRSCQFRLLPMNA
jgi:hypothetical protein